MIVTVTAATIDACQEESCMETATTAAALVAVSTNFVAGCDKMLHAAVCSFIFTAAAATFEQLLTVQAVLVAAGFASSLPSVLAPLSMMPFSCPGT